MGMMKKNFRRHTIIISGWSYRKRLGPVVQLNRTSDSGSESRGFESRRGHQDYEKIHPSFASIAGDVGDGIRYDAFRHAHLGTSSRRFRRQYVNHFAPGDARVDSAAYLFGAGIADDVYLLSWATA